MIMPPDVAVTGLTEPAVRARADAGQVNRAPPVPGRSLLQILRANVLTGLELDEALLTGEAGPVRKQPGDQVLAGSAVVAGTARIRAGRIGGDAYAARLQAQARRFSLIRCATRPAARPPAWWPWCPRAWCCCSPPSRSRRARCGWPGTGSWCRNWRRSRAWPAPTCCASTRPAR